MQRRKTEFSGTWYPGDAHSCEQEIKQFLTSPPRQTTTAQTMLGGIVPHAGWYFSGQIACQVIHALKDEGPPPDVIVIFGMHLPPSAPSYIMMEGVWETPFGDLPIHTDLAEKLTQTHPFTIETATHHQPDNTIELQLPFIKYFFPDTTILPMGVPPASSSLAIGQTLVDLSCAANLTIKVIGSTDLTHYGPNYAFTPQGNGDEALNWVTATNDPNVIHQMQTLNPDGILKEALSHQNACCGGAAATAVATAKALGAIKADQIAYATSFDKSPGQSFVGYVGVVFY